MVYDHDFESICETETGIFHTRQIVQYISSAEYPV
jgi:hypothetical protein